MFRLRPISIGLLTPLLASSVAIAQPAPAENAQHSSTRAPVHSIFIFPVGVDHSLPAGQLRVGQRGSTLIPRSLPAFAAPRQTTRTQSRDSVWNGALIGAAIGAGGGWIWARNICGSNDSECAAYTTPVGLAGGIGIGLAVGAVADLLHK